jgi:hypothetical protein
MYSMQVLYLWLRRFLLPNLGLNHKIKRKLKSHAIAPLGFVEFQYVGGRLDLQTLAWKT